MKPMGLFALRLVRRQIGSVILLALVGALLLGGSLAALGGARRSSTALDRFLVFSRIETLSVAPGDDGVLDMEAVDRLPEVLASSYVSYVAMAPVRDDGQPDTAASGSISPYLRVPVLGGPDAMLRPRVIAGRNLDAMVADEAVVDEELARARHLRPGSVLRMASYTAEQMPELFGPVMPPPRGRVVDFRVTGIVRTPADLVPGGNETSSFGSSMDLYLSPAFYQAWGEGLAVFNPPTVGSGRGLLLRYGIRDLAAFERGVRSLPGGSSAVVAVGASDALDASRAARRAIGVETGALAALGVALAVAGVVLLGQGLARLARGTAVELSSLRAMGGRPRELIVGAALPGACTVAGAALGSVLVALVGSTFTPIGLGRIAEVTPGMRLDTVVVPLGCSLLLVGGLVGALVAAVPTVRSLSRPPAARTPRAGRLVSKVGSLGAPLGPTLGAGFATERSGRREAPLQYAVVVGALALGVVAGVASYTASLDDLASNPTLQGVNWDLTIGNPNGSDFTGADQERLLAHPAVAGASAVTSPDIRGSINGREVAIAGLEQLRGAVGPETTSGRLPTGLGEVTLGRKTAAALDAKPGDQVEVRWNGTTQSMTVVGVAILHPGLAFSAQLGEGAVMTVEQAQAMVPDTPVNVLLTRVVNQTLVDEAVASLQEEFASVSVPLPAVEVVNLRRVRSLPIALAAAIAAAALVLFSVALVSSTRERRRDVGVLRALGATRRQIGVVLVWQGVWLFGGALVGVPIGVAAGRVVWGQVASQLGVLRATQVPIGMLAQLTGVALLLVLLVSGAQVALAVRGQAATSLRAE